MTKCFLRIGALAFATVVSVTACGSDRPSELSMTDVKPCDLISRADLNRLQVKAKPQPLDLIPGVDVEGISCRYFIPDDLGVNNVIIGGITNHGIDRWTSGDFESVTVTDVPPILEFHTIKVVSKFSNGDPHDTCTLYVDVADDQSLMVEVGVTSDKDAPPTCETARKFAEAAMETLTETQ